MRHCSKTHEGESPNYEPLPSDESIEDWVVTLLNRQTEAIKKFLSMSSIESGSSKSDIGLAEKKQTIPKSSNKSVLKTSDTVDLRSEDEDGINISDDDISEIIETGKIILEIYI